MMAETVYILCALTGMLCAVLLFRGFRATRTPLLFWSTCCFVCLTATNILLFVDLVLLPNVDLSVPRGGLTLAGLLMLLFGLIRERS
jgi:hypothetical protein